MALYVVRLTVPPNTPETKPVVKKVVVSGLLLERIEYRFPAGVFESVGVRVLYGNKRLSPKGPEKWVRGENEKIEDPIEWILPAKRCTITVEGFSEAEDFDHTVTVRLLVRPYVIRPEVQAQAFMMRGILDRLRALLGF